METLEELEKNARYRTRALEPVVSQLITLNAQMAAHNSAMIHQQESIITLLMQLRELMSRDR